MIASTTKLTLGDIKDLREYERERDEFRGRVMELKRLRRIGVGPIVTMVFENRDTIRFQIQEMARAERMLSDGQIQEELDIYNPLIPDPGQLMATLFIELTTKDEIMEWLPKLVGIEGSIQILIGEGDDRDVIVSEPDEAHEEQLTREEATASVHYVGFTFTPEQVDRFEQERVELAVDHPEYREATPLSDDTKKSLLVELRGA